jgi:hypothetical protein
MPIVWCVCKRHAALSVHDAFSFVAVLVLLVAVAVVACVALAWRATGINPIDAARAS